MWNTTRRQISSTNLVNQKFSDSTVLSSAKPTASVKCRISIAYSPDSLPLCNIIRLNFTIPRPLCKFRFRDTVVRGPAVDRNNKTSATAVRGPAVDENKQVPPRSAVPKSI